MRLNRYADILHYDQLWLEKGAELLAEVDKNPKLLFEYTQYGLMLYVIAVHKKRSELISKLTVPIVEANIDRMLKPLHLNNGKFQASLFVQAGSPGDISIDPYHSVILLSDDFFSVMTTALFSQWQYTNNPLDDTKKIDHIIFFKDLTVEQQTNILQAEKDLGSYLSQLVKGQDIVAFDDIITAQDYLDASPQSDVNSILEKSCTYHCDAVDVAFFTSYALKCFIVDLLHQNVVSVDSAILESLGRRIERKDKIKISLLNLLCSTSCIDDFTKLLVAKPQFMGNDSFYQAVVANIPANDAVSRTSIISTIVMRCTIPALELFKQNPSLLSKPGMIDALAAESISVCGGYTCNAFLPLAAASKSSRSLPDILKKIDVSLLHNEKLVDALFAVTTFNIDNSVSPAYFLVKHSTSGCSVIHSLLVADNFKLLKRHNIIESLCLLRKSNIDHENMTSILYWLIYHGYPGTFEIVKNLSQYKKALTTLSAKPKFILNFREARSAWFMLAKKDCYRSRLVSLLVDDDILSNGVVFDAVIDHDVETNTSVWHYLSGLDSDLDLKLLSYIDNHEECLDNDSFVSMLSARRKSAYYSHNNISPLYCFAMGHEIVRKKLVSILIGRTDLFKRPCVVDALSVVIHPGVRTSPGVSAWFGLFSVTSCIGDLLSIFDGQPHLFKADNVLFAFKVNNTAMDVSIFDLIKTAVPGSRYNSFVARFKKDNLMSLFASCRSSAAENQDVDLLPGAKRMKYSAPGSGSTF